MQNYAAYFLNKAIASGWDQEHEQEVVDWFKRDLQKMAEAARAHGVRMILCTVASDLRDSAPSGSYHSEGLAAEDLGKWDTLFRAGKDAYARVDYAAAHGHFKRAIKLDPAPAELNFCMGHCLLKLRRAGEAYPYFQAAVDRDAVRNRAGSDINAAIREVALANQIPLADVERAFRERAVDGVPGDELFLDYVHPSLEGHEIIAKLLIHTMIEQGWAEPETEEEMDRAAADYLDKANDDYLFASYYKAASYNAALGRFLHARKWVDEALKLSPRDPDALKMKQCLTAIISLEGRDRDMPWAEVELVRGRE
ncbi:MAG TPA: SGNH/GDSL hydrolase family protein [bacterium]|nr:SGNH/GDSL hydrolase family protein [bacterium]